MRATALALLLAAPALAGGFPTPEPPASPRPSSSARPYAPPRSFAARKPAEKAVTKERAREIARKTVADLSPDAHFVVLEAKTIEKPFGWVFFYEPQAAASDPNAMVPGAGPLVVHRADGSTTFLSTSVPPAEAIAEYEKVLAKRSLRKP